jgi:hypothetical protein
MDLFSTVTMFFHLGGYPGCPGAGCASPMRMDDLATYTDDSIQIRVAIRHTMPFKVVPFSRFLIFIKTKK